MIKTKKEDAVQSEQVKSVYTQLVIIINTNMQ